jgi:predicted permease
MNRPIERILAVYRRLLRKLPEDFQRRHGSDLVRSTEDLMWYAARRNRSGFVSTIIRVFGDLLWRIPIEHFAEFRQDVRYGARTLGRSPGFTIAAVISLAIGIGSLVSIYSIAELLFFTPVSEVREPDDLVTLMSSISYPDYEDLRNDGAIFSEVAAYIAPVPFKIDSEQQRILGHIVSPDYFAVLGAKTAAGRVFDADEKAVVISHRLWANRFAGAPDVIGRTIRLNGKPVTVAGVTVENFSGAIPLIASADVWITTAAADGIAPELNFDVLRRRDVDVFKVVGRLQPGTAVPAAGSALDAILKRSDHPESSDAQKRARLVRLVPGGRLVPLPDEVRPMFLVPCYAMGLLYLWVVCSNIGTFLLARSGPRRKEIAIRVSMGASRSRIVRQLITESLMLALLGGAAGWVFAIWSNSTIEWFRPLLPGHIDFSLRLSWSAMLFTLVMVAVSAVGFGLIPALQAARGDVLPGLKSAGELFDSRRRRWLNSRNMLVLQQIAGALMLVLFSGFVALGFERTGNLDLGFSPQNIYIASVDSARDGFSVEQARGFLSDLPNRVAMIPGIEHATVTRGVPVSPFTARAAVQVDGKAGYARIEGVGGGYFETLALPVLRGRGISADDFRSRARVAVVNEAMIEAYWPGQNPVGRQFDVKGKRYEVIGVTRNSRAAGLVQPSGPGVYMPMDEEDPGRPAISGATVLVRVRPGFDPSVRLHREISAIDPELSVFNVKPLLEEVAQITYTLRMMTFSNAVLGFCSLALAAVGLSGLTAYSVAQRTKEIGIRMALGARPHRVLGLVLKESAALVVAGTLIGHACAWAAAHALGFWVESMTQLTKTSSSDPMLNIGAPVLLGTLTMLSCYLPARRATRIDPLISLRQE